MRRLLLEEEGFEDIEEVEEPTEVEETESTGEEQPVETTEEDDVDTSIFDGIEPETTLYKVTFTLGNHENWSRVDAQSETEAEEIVREYVTKKWADREFEVVSVEEFEEDEISEELLESLSRLKEDMVGEYSDKFFELLKSNDDSKFLSSLCYDLIRYCKEEDLKDLWVKNEKHYAQTPIDESMTDAQPIETGAAIGMATIVGDLIKDEYEAIEGYNSAIATASAEGFEDAITVLTEIQAEENIHIGQLLEVMKLFDPNAEKVEEGQAEGAEQLSGVSVVEEE